MRIKVSYRAIMRYIIWFLVIIECDYFTFFDFPVISDYYTRNYVIAFFSMLLFVWSDFFIGGALSSYEKRKVRPLMVMTFACMAVCAVYYIFVCKMANNVMVNIAPFFCILLTYPIIYITKEPEQSRKFWIGVCTIVIISLLIRTKVVLDYYNTGLISNEALLIPNGGIKLRYGILKIYPTSLGAFVVVFLFAKGVALASKHKLQSIILIAISTLGYLYFALLYQGRSWTFLLLLIFLLTVICKRDKMDKKVMAFALVGIIIIYLFFSGTVESFFESFLMGSQYWHSTELRIEGSSYILKSILSHPFGNGFTTEFVSNGKTFYPDDYGMLETLYRFGYLGFVLIALYYKHMFKCYKATKNNDNKTIVFAVSIYFIFGSIIFDAFIIRRIFSVPFVLGLTVSLSQGGNFVKSVMK